MDKEQVEAFLAELTALTIKHGIAIEGCGCCESPYLTETAYSESAPPDERPPISDAGHYTVTESNELLEWVQR